MDVYSQTKAVEKILEKKKVFELHAVWKGPWQWEKINFKLLLFPWILGIFFVPVMHLCEWIASRKLLYINISLWMEMRGRWEIFSENNTKNLFCNSYIDKEWLGFPNIEGIRVNIMILNCTSKKQEILLDNKCITYLDLFQVYNVSKYS